MFNNKLSSPRGLQLILCYAVLSIAWTSATKPDRDSMEFENSSAMMLLSPAPNTTFPISSTVPFLVSGSNPDVVRVGIFVNSDFVTYAPRDGSNDFSFAIGGLSFGHHTIGYAAYDANDNLVESSASIVSIGTQEYGAFPVYGGRVAIETEQFESQISRGEDFWVKRTNFPGFSLSGYMETIYDNGTRVITGYSQTASELKYKIIFDHPGTYYLWYRGYGTSSSQNSVHFGLEGQEIPSLRDVGFNQYNQWVWTNQNGSNVPATVNIPSAGEYEFNLWMREDGTKIDKFILTDDSSYQPSGVGNRGEGRLVQGIRFEASALLSGAIKGSSMRTDLVQLDLLPYLSSPDAEFQVQLPDEYFNDNDDIVDWIEIECRSQLYGQVSDILIPALLRNDGQIVNPDGSKALICPASNSAAFYIKLNHRNHLAIMTKDRIISADMGLVELDFIGNPSLAYEPDGAAQRTTALGYAMWAGDVDGNGTVSYAGSNNDRVLILDAAGGPTPFDEREGYLDSDLNLDGRVRYAGSENDRVLILENSGGPTPFDRRSSQVP